MNFVIIFITLWETFVGYKGSTFFARRPHRSGDHKKTLSLGQGVLQLLHPATVVTVAPTVSEILLTLTVSELRVA